MPIYVIEDTSTPFEGPFLCDLVGYFTDLQKANKFIEGKEGLRVITMKLHEEQK